MSNKILVKTKVSNISDKINKVNLDEKINTSEKRDVSEKIAIVLNKKIKYLEDIRHEIKKRRILFDENKERFGLNELSQLIKVKNIMN